MRQAMLHLYAALATSLTLMLPAAALAQAAPNIATTTKFEPAIQVQGNKLTLNGAGTRFKTVIKVYDMALYTTRKVNSTEELIALPGPKRLQFTALRELPSTDLGRMFIKGMSDNATKDQMLKHTLSSTRLIEVFSGKSKLVAGDSFAMEYLPGKGTVFYILGKPQGDPVGDAEFFTMVLKIWFGSSPADYMLKEALLGV